MALNMAIAEGQIHKDVADYGNEYRMSVGTSEQLLNAGTATVGDKTINEQWHNPTSKPGTGQVIGSNSLGELEGASYFLDSRDR